MPIIKTVGIISKPNVPAAVGIVPNLLEWLNVRGIAARIDQQTAEYAHGLEGLPREDVPEGCDLVIVLGGDGSLLSAARAEEISAAPHCEQQRKAEPHTD